MALKKNCEEINEKVEKSEKENTELRTEILKLNSKVTELNEEANISEKESEVFEMYPSGVNWQQRYEEQVEEIEEKMKQPAEDANG